MKTRLGIHHVWWSKWVETHWGNSVPHQIPHLLMTPCKAVASAYVCHNHGRCYWMLGSVDVRDVLHVHTKCKWREHLQSEGRSDAEGDEEVILVCSQRVSRCVHSPQDVAVWWANVSEVKSSSWEMISLRKRGNASFKPITKLSLCNRLSSAEGKLHFCYSKRMSVRHASIDIWSLK